MFTHKLLGVIFDLDNTLVSSSLDFDSIRASLGCIRDMDLLDFVDALPEQQKVEANELLIEYELNDCLTTEKLSGTDELLTLLSRVKIPCAIVTRNSREAALLKVHHNNIDIPLLLTREDHKAKPAPDALLYIANLWNIPPKNLLYVGDYLYDIQAAKNADTMSCLVTHGKTASYENLADIVVNELTDLNMLVTQHVNLTNISTNGF